MPSTDPSSTDPGTPGEREKELGRRLRLARNESEMGLNQAASASGVSAVSIQKYETARRTPTVHRLVSLAKLYGVSMDWLVGLSSARDPFPPGLVIEDSRVVEGILGAKTEADLLPLLNWRPSIYLALIEVPGKFRLQQIQGRHFLFNPDTRRVPFPFFRAVPRAICKRSKGLS